MAKFERTFMNQGFDSLVERVERAVLHGSYTATLEDQADYRQGDARCAVRVFERYSYTGGNRVSMSVTIFQSENVTRLCAITSGGSSAVWFKFNTWGEESFLDTLRVEFDR
ncbi:MAG: hypothetical protein IKD27_00765 [Oscillospiraceae bacterium]|nr:hypothetical protein [Oscillospiraceae bacterium]